MERTVGAIKPAEALGTGMAGTDRPASPVGGGDTQNPNSKYDPKPRQIRTSGSIGSWRDDVQRFGPPNHQ